MNNTAPKPENQADERAVEIAMRETNSKPSQSRSKRAASPRVCGAASGMGGGLAGGADGLPLAQDFKDEDGTGRGDVEAVFVAVHGNFNQLVAALKRFTTHAEGLIAHDEGQWARIV